MQGFRDPFVVQTIETMNRPEKHIIVGSGLRGRGGTILVYRATDVTQPWDFAGVLCTEGTDTGPIWECPGLISVPVEHVAGHTPRQAQRSRDVAGAHSLQRMRPMTTAWTAHPCTRSGYATLGPQHAGPPGRADGASFGHVPPSPGAPATVDLLSVGHFPPDTCLTHCWLGHYDPDSCRFDLANARGECLRGNDCRSPGPSQARALTTPIPSTQARRAWITATRAMPRPSSGMRTVVWSRMRGSWRSETHKGWVTRGAYPSLACSARRGPGAHWPKHPCRSFQSCGETKTHVRCMGTGGARD